MAFLPGDAGRAGVGEGVSLKDTVFVMTEVTGRGERGDRGDMEPSIAEGGGARLGGGGVTSSSSAAGGGGGLAGAGFGEVSFGTAAGLGSARVKPLPVDPPIGELVTVGNAPAFGLALDVVNGDLAPACSAAGSAAGFLMEIGADLGAAGDGRPLPRKESSSNSSNRSILVIVTARGFRAFCARSPIPAHSHQHDPPRCKGGYKYCEF